MMIIRMQISYDGTDYAGWQRQGDKSPDPRPTIQATIESALSKVFNTTIKVQASGRTDAGVHALAQNIHFKVPVNLAGAPIKNPLDMKLVRSINALTPDSIAVSHAWIAPDDYHSLHSAEKKTYRYVIHNSPTPDPIRHRYSYWFEKPLDINKLNGLTECLIGEHDFKSFQTSGTELKTTVRRILEACWVQVSPELIEFHITGTGFLKQMVRNIVGTTIYLHQNDYGPDEMKRILAACDRQVAKTTAEPQGLFLDKVYYPADLDNRCREL
ncbi:MAG: tRNA pseudouridine(38-40) synthase TruA [Bdellovibrionales bacterium]|nr:tRNA pseudouridine(38-40) synthase TruA [Bdellovibrionales bacterium]